VVEPLLQSSVLVPQRQEFLRAVGQVQRVLLPPGLAGLAQFLAVVQLGGQCVFFVHRKGTPSLFLFEQRFEMHQTIFQFHGRGEVLLPRAPFPFQRLVLHQQGFRMGTDRLQLLPQFGRVGRTGGGSTAPVLAGLVAQMVLMFGVQALHFQFQLRAVAFALDQFLLQFPHLAVERGGGGGGGFRLLVLLLLGVVQRRFGFRLRGSKLIAQHLHLLRQGRDGFGVGA
jgi:hypothetical protein